ncbi:MAG TPA: methyl-accepting chemotaxis protein [Aromatoleum sp.]|uniref:methyl-accepting chemotaxis protein n=1 Tax=Aromatoleum sp. TaxID=2307007 RepID=UPI002B4A59A3|nr:methyl-accepting chemotaxis protein [Aromatoleum sp.]HJV26355.1 methyl-accepting chemotaxis protein [Aromatoleum sp.]
MMQRLRNSPIWVRLILAIGSLLIAVGTTLVLWVSAEQERMAISQSHDFAETINQMTMATLVFMKSTKTMKKRAIYLDQVKKSSGLTDMRVVRAEPVINQFGDGDEDEMNVGPDEKAAIESGQPFFEVRDDPAKGKILKAVFPHTNRKSYLGKDCTECHDEPPEGVVLGAVTMEVSLNSMAAGVSAARTKLIGGTVAALGLMIVLIFVFLQAVVARPLGVLSSRLRDIADGEGDLTQRLPVAALDEVGQAATYFNRMMEKLQDVIRKISTSADQVSGAASDLQRGTTEIRAGAGEQSEKSASAASAVEEMAASIMSVAQASGEVAELARNSLARAESGNTDVVELTGRLSEVDAAVGKMTHTAGDFIEKTSAITNLTARVKEIADQTNLLALNAAIEAARAGEHGRGFAVVADEVRKLAEKSTRSASDIDDVTNSLNAGSEEVRAAITQGSLALIQIRESMQRVSDALQSNMDSATRVADGMTSIATATEEQMQASGLAASSVEMIAGLAQKASTSIDGVASATESLEHLAADLRDEIRRFRV